MANNLKGLGLEDAGGLTPQLATKEEGGVHWPRSMPIGLVIPDYDAQVSTYNVSGQLTKLTFKNGGVDGTVVAALNYSYVTSGAAAGNVLNVWLTAS